MRWLQPVILTARLSAKAGPQLIPSLYISSALRTPVTRGGDELPQVGLLRVQGLGRAYGPAYYSPWVLGASVPTHLLRFCP
ncbi:hypothetical protein SAMN04515695_2954 [Pseudovibrio sp. Tun.PSC04-5.I4]|nr:hypothetical protein SAMN04515695_2954 [Pseudovibrio sp. Tun.PSC04-5.I4]